MHARKICFTLHTMQYVMKIKDLYVSASLVNSIADTMGAMAYTKTSQGIYPFAFTVSEHIIQDEVARTSISQRDNEEDRRFILLHLY